MARTALTRPLPCLHSRLTLPEALWHALAAAGVAAFRSTIGAPTKNRSTRPTHRLASGPCMAPSFLRSSENEKPIGQAFWRWVRNFDLAKLLASGSACPHQKTPLRNTDNSSLRTRSCMVCRTYEYSTIAPQPAPTQFFNVFYRESKRAKKAGGGVRTTWNSLVSQNTTTSCHPEKRAVHASKDLNFNTLRDPELEIHQSLRKCVAPA
jgi:hypothetical protein